MRSTTPLSQQPRENVETVSVEVVAGPEQGLRAEAQDDHFAVGTAPGCDLVVSDGTVSGYHLELSRAPTGIQVVDLGSTNGTLVGAIRIERAVVPSGTVVELGRTRLRVASGKDAAVEVHGEDSLYDVLGRSARMRRLLAQLARVAQTPTSVLLFGESGTGKELFARAIHQASGRAKGPFITVDCASLSPTLVASELFGHERGAFTGADRQRIGAFERAHGGTLFLDEIGELPADLQPQLLGALERRRFLRLGGKTEVKVDVRVVSATNRELRSEVNAGRFRMDLYFRLAIVVLRLPALRERLEDLPLLVEHFLRLAGHAGPVESVLSEQVRSELLRYRWPGNVRELRNWVEATLALGESPELFLGEQRSSPSERGEGGLVERPSMRPPPPTGLGPGIANTEPAMADQAFAGVLAMPYKEARETLLDGFEARYLRSLLEASAGNVAQAARKARMDRSYLIKMLQRHGLRVGRSSVPPVSSMVMSDEQPAEPQTSRDK